MLYSVHICHEIAVVLVLHVFKVYICTFTLLGRIQQVNLFPILFSLKQLCHICCQPKLEPPFQ